MTAIALQADTVPAMTADQIERVRELEARLRSCPQAQIATDHLLHGGMYARTICIPAGTVLTGVFVSVPTLLIFDGHATVYLGDSAVTLHGYRVLPASAGRRQAFLAHADTFLTMVFVTRAATVAEAEEAFTSEACLLLSRHANATNHIRITGE